MADDKSDTEQTELKRDDKGRFAGGTPPAGFNVHPENRSDGGWRKEDSIGYQYRMLIRLTDKDFKQWEKDNPDDERTVAQVLAHAAVIKARKDLSYLKEVTDRTEGRAVQHTDLTTKGDKLESRELPTETLSAFSQFVKEKTQDDD